MKRADLAATSSLSLPPDSYVYTIAPVDHNVRIAAISSDESLRIIDASTLNELSNLPSLHGGVTCLDAAKDDANCLLTAGRDGVVRHWDLRLGHSTLEFQDVLMRSDSKAPYLSLCSGETGPVVGTELHQSQASVIQWDKRFPTTPLLQYVESHNDDVTVVCYTFPKRPPTNQRTNSNSIQLHPNSPTTLLSGSTDGLVNIYNTTQPTEDDALLQVSNHGSSIHRAGFLSDTQIYALSHDECFSVYQLNNPDGSSVDDIPENAMGDLRQPLHCEYVVDCIPSFESGQAILAAGSHSLNRLDVVPIVSAGSGAWTYDAPNTVTLPGAHGEEIVRSMFFDHQGRGMFTAGEDGKIKAWRISSEASNSGDQVVETNLKKPKRKKKHKSTDGGDGKGRFKPY